MINGLFSSVPSHGGSTGSLNPSVVISSVAEYIIGVDILNSW